MIESRTDPSTLSYRASFRKIGSHPRLPRKGTSNWSREDRLFSGSTWSGRGRAFGERNPNEVCVYPDWNKMEVRAAPPMVRASVTRPKAGVDNEQCGCRRIDDRMGFMLVELTGIEPVTSCMPCKRSPS